MHVQSIRDDGKRKPGFLDWAVAEKDPKVSTGQAEFEESGCFSSMGSYSRILSRSFYILDDYSAL